MLPTSSPKWSTSESREKRTRSALVSSEKTSSSQKAHKGNSEARKLQNRIASKNYREKRKRKLEYLQQLLESQPFHNKSLAVSPSESTEDCLRSRPYPLSGEQCNLVHGSDLASILPSEQGPPILVSSDATPEPVRPISAFDELVSVCQGPFENFDRTWPSPLFIGSSQGSDNVPSAFDETWFSEISDFTNDGDFQFQPSLPLQQPQGRTSELSVHIVGTADSDLQLPTVMGRSSAFTAGSQSFSNVGASASLQIYDPRGSEVQDAFKKLSIQYNGLPLEKKQQLIKIVHAHGFNLLDAIRSFLENDGLATPESNLPSTTRSSLNSGKRREELPRITESSVSLVARTYQRSPVASKVADLHVNSFRIHQISFFAALFANARALGFEFIDYLSDSAISPVYTPGLSAADQNQLARSYQRFAFVSRDICPTVSQITKQHHPYIDILPFPNFRDRVLAATSTDPPLIDEDELCLDFSNDGMVCWGSTSGNLGMQAGVSWDMRSWEPAIWFLRKYWFLIDGQEDDMWKSARWWHMMRGERMRI